MLERFVPYLDVSGIFNNAFKELNDRFECTYLNYQFQYKEFKLVFFSHAEWMKTYTDNSFHKNCPLLRVGTQKLLSGNSNIIILRWRDVLPTSQEEKNTVNIRSEFNICNGISFGRQQMGVLESIGLATDKKNFNFTNEILFNSPVVRSVMDNLFQATSIKLISDYITTNASFYHPKQHNDMLRLINSCPTQPII